MISLAMLYHHILGERITSNSTLRMSRKAQVGTRLATKRLTSAEHKLPGMVYNISEWTPVASTNRAASSSVRRSIRFFAGIKKRTNATYIYPIFQRMRRVKIYGYHRIRGKRYFGRVDSLVEGEHCRN